MKTIKIILVIFYFILFHISLIINIIGKLLIIFSFFIIGDINTVKKKLKTLKQPNM